jgi:beta-lactamase superfamily II metal-dependent hydrolase
LRNEDAQQKGFAMQVYTLNIGQGQFVVVTGTVHAFIVDTFVPLSPTQPVINVKAALASILAGKELVGLIITGFDSDHFNEVGMRIVLNKYRPNWIMYPKYFKKTDTANTCFSIIESFERVKTFTRCSISLSDNATRFYYNLSSEFIFEMFSPHSDDMNSSNNCSLVCKVIERSTGITYLITGDTEDDRWESIVKYFGGALAANILAAPHHGSEHGITESAIKLIAPKTVLISAGVGNQYGHPDAKALQLFRMYSEHYYSTNWGNGQSLRTEALLTGINTYKFEPSTGNG